MMHRRSMLLGSTALVAGCQTFDQTLSTVVADVNSIAGALAADLPQLSTLTGINPSIMGTVAEAITALQAVAKSLGSATSIAAAQPLVQKVELYVNTIIQALAVIPLIPPPFNLILQGAALLLPVIEAAVNLVATPAATISRSVRLAAPMTIDQARVVLRAEASKFRP